MIVADAGPFIALARVRQLDLLQRLYGQVLIPPAVLHELALGSGRPGAAVLEDALGSGWLVEQGATHANAVSALAPRRSSSLKFFPRRTNSQVRQSSAAKRFMRAAKGMASVFWLRGKLSSPEWTTNRSVACTSSAAKAKPLPMRGVALRLTSTAQSSRFGRSRRRSSSAPVRVR